AQGGPADRPGRGISRCAHLVRPDGARRLQGRPAALHACLPAVRRAAAAGGYLAQTRQHRLLYRGRLPAARTLVRAIQAFAPRRSARPPMPAGSARRRPSASGCAAAPSGKPLPPRANNAEQETALTRTAACVRAVFIRGRGGLYSAGSSCLSSTSLVSRAIIN